MDFPCQGSIIFHNTNLPLHENEMKIHAFANSKKVYSKTYYSIGGGFIFDEEHFGKKEVNTITVPYPFNSAEEILANCR